MGEAVLLRGAVSEQSLQLPHGEQRGTLKFTSSFVLSVGVAAFERHPVPVPRHVLLVPVLFQVKLSKHRAVVRSHPTPGPVVGDPWVCKTFSHNSPVACVKKNHREDDE